jgi:predicted nucleic acid-binding protein
VVKWFLDERDSEDARRLRNSFATSELTLAVPSLLLYETLNVLRYAGLYTRDELVSVARALSQYGFEVLEPAEKLYEETARLSIECNITVYDAAYVAVASHLDAPLYTADAELVNKQLAKHIKTFKAKS